MNYLKAFWRDEEGLSMVEYAVIAAAIIVVAAAVFKGIGTGVESKMQEVNTALQ